LSAATSCARVAGALASSQLETSGEVMALRACPSSRSHFTAILRRHHDGLGILECRPHAFLPAT
jgi:hypothetical protein